MSGEGSAVTSGVKDVQVRDMRLEDIDEVVALHCRVFSDYLLGRLGADFLRIYYRALMADPGNSASVAIRGGRIAGFVAGSQNPKAFYQRLYRRHGVPLALIALRRGVVDPLVRRGLFRRRNHLSLLGSVWTGIPSHAVFTASRHAARLLSIATDVSERGSGMAALLADSFCSRMAERGVDTVGLSVRSENARAIAFYQKTGWQAELDREGGIYFIRSTKPHVTDEAFSARAPRVPVVLMLADASSIHTVRWVNAIADRNWKVHLLSLRDRREPLDPRVQLHRPPMQSRLGYITNASFVRSVVGEIKPDLVHAHYVSGYGTLAARADAHPLVMSVWGSDIYSFPTRSPLHSWLVRRNLARADVILSTSRAMAQHTKRYTDRDIGITPFGIDTERFRPRPTESPFAESDIVVGTVKTMSAIYGIKYLVRAFHLVKLRHPELPLKLLLVGGGPQERFLKRLVAKAGLTPSVLFTGPIPHDQVADYQNMLSISVSVSTQESFGVAVLEAAACEKPVVVSSVGGLPEVVEEGTTGFIVPPRDPVLTAAAIEKLALDPALRARMGRAGRQRVLALFAWEKCVDIMLGEYRSAMAQPRSGKHAE